MIEQEFVKDYALRLPQQLVDQLESESLSDRHHTHSRVSHFPDARACATEHVDNS